MTGVWVTNDTISATRMNEKTIIQASGSTINGLTTYAGMLAYCTSSGSGFVADVLYVRNAANTSWSAVGVDQLPYLPLSTTIGDYSAPVAAVSSSDFVGNYTDDFTTDKMTYSGSTYAYNAANDNQDFTIPGSANTDNSYVDMTGAVVSDTLWVLRFKLVFSAFTATTTGLKTSDIGLFSATTGMTTSPNDGLWFQFGSDSSVKYFFMYYSDGTAPSGGSASTIFTTTPSATTYYIELKRTSATNITTNIYSDSTFTTLTETKSFTVPATVINLRYFQHACRTTGTPDGSEVGTLDDVNFWNGVSSPPVAANVFDTDTATYWKSQSEANPRIYVDLTSAREIVGVALNINKTDTTITSLKIRASTDTTFTDGENIAYVNLTDFTDDTWRFLANNWLADNRRYVQFYANETGVFSINEIKVRYGVSDTVKLLSHKHRTRTTSSADSFTDSN